MTLFKLFAGTDIGLRDNNEDNFTVNPDLTHDEWMVPANQQGTIQLGKRGCLMVVADGMGGMNAGEVASAIAIKTVQKLFSPAKMSAKITERPDSIREYLKKAIIEADRQIKRQCKKDPSTEGMGSTIVLAWLIDGFVYVGWLGDSRAYSYIPEKGISRLSKDHSFVQELVDARKITEEEAMLHPQSNVIMRSLGDASQKAKPDIIRHPVVKDEIILLCSDGLCGVCNDATISKIIGQTSSDLRLCKETLTETALDAGGSDNITISLLQIVETPFHNTGDDWTPKNVFKTRHWMLWQNAIFVFFALFLLAGLSYAGYKGFYSCSHKKRILPKDSVSRDSTDTSRVIVLEKKAVSPKDTIHSLEKIILQNKDVNTEARNEKDEKETQTNPEDELSPSSGTGVASPERLKTQDNN